MLNIISMKIHFHPHYFTNFNFRLIFDQKMVKIPFHDEIRVFYIILTQMMCFTQLSPVKNVKIMKTWYDSMSLVIFYFHLSWICSILF